MTAWLAGMRLTAGRLNDGLDPTVQLTGLVAASGFTVNDFRGYRSGKVLSVDMYLMRSGATITATAGNLSPDVAICTLPAGWAPTNGTIDGIWDSGSEYGGFVTGTDGITTLRTASGNIIGEATSPGNGRNLRLHLDFIVA